MTIPKHPNVSGLALYRARQAEEKRLRMAELAELRQQATTEVMPNSWRASCRATVGRCYAEARRD